MFWQEWACFELCHILLHFWKFEARFTCHRFDQAMTSILVENFNGYQEVYEILLNNLLQHLIQNISLSKLFRSYNANISWLNSEEQIGKPIRSGAHELEIGDGKKVGKCAFWSV